MKRFLKTITALVLSCSLLLTPVMGAQSFKDVPSDFWGYTFVARAAEEKLVSGKGNGNFGVNDPLSNAEFTTMICNLFYRAEVDAYQATYQPALWWRSFMAVAYTKGLLDNTVVGTSRATNNSWKTSVVEGKISRYDMAQIMVNVAKAQGWDGITAQQALDIQSKIADWNTIPVRYQAAVAAAYVMGWLSGNDAKGTFGGNESMTRLHGAIVICKLLDAKEENTRIETPEFTNTTKLVNGKEATPENVVKAIAELQKTYPTGYIWSTAASYRSKDLGTGTGGEALLYMLSDQIFGNLTSERMKNDQIKPGDLIWLDNEECYILVSDADEGVLSYLSCSATGRVAWDGTMKAEDLTDKDKVYSRYEYEEEEEEEITLTNGEAITEENVYDLLVELSALKAYREFRDWDMSEKHDTQLMGTCRGSKAFASVISDEVFGELEDYLLEDAEDVRSGDVLYLNDTDSYGVVLAVYTRSAVDYIEYATVDEDGEISWQTRIPLEDLNLKYDQLYTRYPD